MLLQFMMSCYAKDYGSFKDTRIEFVEKQKVLKWTGAMMPSVPPLSSPPTGQPRNQMEILTLLMIKHKQASTLKRTECYNCREERYVASQ